VTPELYLGFARGQFGNPAGVAQDRAADYSDPGRHAEGVTYLRGRWTVSQESSRAEASDAALALRYTAMDVNLVLAPPAGASGRAELVLGQDQLGQAQRPGADAKLENGRVFVTVDRPRMYNLVANESVLPGNLELRVLDVGITAYAFTFVSCVVDTRRSEAEPS
jgi:hypothetical protein